MNHVLNIALCLSICVSFFPVFPADLSAVLFGTADKSASLIVPPIRPWLNKAQEAAKEPEVVTLIKNYTGQEPFHEAPAHQRMLSAHLEQLMRNLNDDTVQELAGFLTLCQQKNVQIDYMSSDDLFRLAYHKRTARETVYKSQTERQIGGWATWCAQHTKMMQRELYAHQKQAERQVLELGSVCATAKTKHAPIIDAYTTIMQLTKTLNPQYRPSYATDPEKYYDDIEQKFILATKLQKQAALAAHVQGISKLLTELALIDKVSQPKNAMEQIEQAEAHVQSAQKHIESAAAVLMAGAATAAQPSQDKNSSIGSTTATATPSDLSVIKTKLLNMDVSKLDEGLDPIEIAKRRIAARKKIAKAMTDVETQKQKDTEANKQ